MDEEFFASFANRSSSETFNAIYAWTLFKGPLLLPDGRSTPRCHLRTVGFLPLHRGNIHRSRGRSGNGDAVCDPWKAGKLHHERGKNRILQFHSFKTRGFLR
ncbi:hypothetical protein HPP92_017981 [Vanilla planifolia]|uniref:Uncharacterized protein n=1 Tax=Vanilla planifolia TaxID=51239 RepID=A0A835UP33_VANPL|nr:hypothetical protein HPP92_017981 [Vanilla planifolia]